MQGLINKVHSFVEHHTLKDSPFSRTQVLWMLLGIGVIAFVVRTWSFGSVPPGLNQDEVSTAYDAWAIAHYGIDRNGVWLPAVLISWGSGMNALPAYAAVPFMWLFGLSEYTVRIVNLVFGLASLPIFYLLVRKATDHLTALCAVLLAAISPWHIMISRWGLDENLFPFVFLIGVFLLVSQPTRNAFRAAAAVVLGLSLGAHGASYFTVPFFALCMGMYFFRQKILSVRTAFVPAAILFVLALPHFIYLAINRFHWDSIVTPFGTVPALTGVARYETVSAVFSSRFFPELWSNLLRFVDFLRTGQDGMLWSALPGVGLTSFLTIPLAVFGLISVCSRKNKTHGEQTFLLWLLASVGLAALLSANANRMNILLFPLLFFAAVGLRQFINAKLVFGTLIACLMFSFGSFSYQYFATYPAMIGPAFQQGLPDAIGTAAAATSSSICVTDHANMPYIYALFSQKTNPHVFVQTVEYINPGAEFQGVSTFDRFLFGLSRCEGRDIGAYVAAPDEVSQFDPALFSLETIGVYTVALPR